MATGAEFQFRFVGKNAEEGSLNFYELSRSQYASARLIYTLARYRETGRVLAKITEKVTTDIRARPVEQGSFIYSAFEYLSEAAAAAAVGIPLNALFALIWDGLIPIGKGKQYAEVLAKERLLEAQQRHVETMSKQETERLQIIKDILEGQSVSHEKALSFLAEQRQIERERADHGMRLENIDAAMADIRSEVNRNDLLNKHSDALRRISEDDRNKLVAKARRQVMDIALPTRSSATDLYIGESANDNRYCRLDFGTATEIADENTTKEEAWLSGKIVRYDTDNGSGRFRLSEAESKGEYGAQVYFFVPRSERATLGDEVIDAMHFGEVSALFSVTRGAEGLIKNLELQEVIIIQDAV